MGILSSFTSPRDIRWQGPQRHHHAIFLVKDVILLLFIILVIVEYSLFRSWWESGPYHYHRSWSAAPYYFWLRIGLALVPDALLTLLSLILILHPRHQSTSSFHPIFALTSSLFMFGLYANVCWLNPLLALTGEVGFPNSQIWDKIVFVETAFEGVVCLCYVAMIVCSCVAVHKWRMAKRAINRKMEGVEKREGKVSEESRA